MSQHVEELPTCLNEEGLYLDTSLSICKKITHYVYGISPGTSKEMLPFPELREGGEIQSSYTLSFWVYLGLRTSAYTVLIEHGPNASTVNLAISLDN